MSLDYLSDLPLNAQKAFREVELRLRTLEKRIEGANGTELSADVDQIKSDLAKVVRKPTTLDFNDVVRGAGRFHALGYAPDPGPYPGQETAVVLHANGGYRRVLDGLIQAVPSGVGGTSAAQRILNVLCSLSVTGNISGANAVLKALEVMGGTGYIHLKQMSPDILPVIIRAHSVTEATIQPDAISGLKGWYKADAGVFEDAGTDPAENNDPVQQWNDQSGNGFHFTQATLGFRPIFKTGIVNGKPVIRWDASGVQMSYATGSNLVTSPGTIFLVGSITDASADNTTFFDATADGTSPGHRAGIGKTVDNTFMVTNYDGNLDTATKSGTTATVSIITRISDGANLSIGVNDTRTSSLTSTASGNITGLSSTITYGVRWGIAFTACDIAEVVFYDSVLSEFNRKGVEGYLALKYGITLPYTPESYGTVDLLRVEKPDGSEIFRVDKSGDVYVRGIKLNVP